MSRLAWVTSVSCCLSFVMTSLAVTARLSLLWLLRLYKYEQIHPATWYMVVLMLLATPYLTQLIYIIWNTPILSPANRPKSPFCWNIILGILSSVLEGAAMTVFAAEVTPVLPEPVLLTLPYAVLGFSVISNVFVTHETLNTAKANDTIPCLSPTLMRLGLGVSLFMAPLFTGILLYTGSHFRVNLTELCGLVICLPILSGVWNPLVQKTTIRSRSSKEMTCPMVELVYATVKVISIVTAVYLTLYCKFSEMKHDAVEFLGNARDEWNDVFIIAPVALCLFSGILGLMAAAASAKLGLITAGMKVPFFLCPILVCACTVGVWHDIQTDAIWELSGDDLASWSTIVLSVFVWITPISFPVLKLMKSPSASGRSFSENFISFSWNVFFFEPRLVLNYKSDSIRDFDQNNTDHDAFIANDFEKSKSQVKTIFLCTTMYKENQSEMERYVSSIKDTFDNIQDSALNIEAHVLFDGAVEDGKLNVKARQLIVLLCDRFALSYQQLVNKATPYGCQTNTGNHLRHRIFIHFKNSSLVKNKKRWSQVMYLNYILQFRCGLDNVFKFDVNRVSKNHNLYEVKHFSKDAADMYTSMECKPVQKEDCNALEIVDACTLSEFELVRMQAEYARIRRRVSDPVEVSSYPIGTAAVPTAKCCKVSFPGADNSQLGQSRSCSEKTSGLTDLNMEDYLIKTITGDTFGTRSQSCEMNEIFKNDPDFNGCSISANKDPTRYSSTHGDAGKLTTIPLDTVFILATDADTAFNAKSVLEVLSRCENSSHLGAVCGRTVPIGSPKPIVWYQKFEYAKDFWLVKASQNVIGSVTCCPGCFSLYRGSALADVFREFSQPTVSGFDSLVKDHGEDRWLCTLLMQKGWRLAYTAHAHNSTHCPETVGEFLRQRRRWVLSEFSNMLSIFLSVPELVRHNSSFSGMFLISLFMTFLWIILSPSTTLVFLCAGGDVLYSVPLTFSLPFAALLFLAYAAVCCFTAQSRQKLASLLLTVSIATVTFVLSVGFVMYVVTAMQKDLDNFGSIQFRPYFLVFLLILATIYAAVLHPKESLSLVYGLCYALLFPAIFMVLPVYSLTNMVDQSWGTREPGSHRCCQSADDSEDEMSFTDLQINTTDLPSLSGDIATSAENKFWESLKNDVIGRDVHTGKTDVDISRDLRKLRQTSVILLLIANCVWFVFLSVLYVYAGSDTICYCVASVFSFSLILQLVGLTCYRIHSLIDRYLRVHDVKNINVDFRP